MKDQKKCDSCVRKKCLIEAKQYYENKLVEIEEQINKFPSFRPCTNTNNSLQSITLDASINVKVISMLQIKNLLVL